jgi:hypothetical protein
LLNGVKARNDLAPCLHLFPGPLRSVRNIIQEQDPMNILKLAAAAALALSSLAMASAPAAAAQRGERWEQNDNGRQHSGERRGRDNDRGNYRNNRGGRDGYRGNRGGRGSWRGDRGGYRGNHYGWRNNRRNCRTIWRHGHRQRVCYR